MISAAVSLPLILEVSERARGAIVFSNHKVILNFTGLFLAILFHGTYDFFLFIDYIPGVWLGAFLSLLIGLFLSRKAIQKHQDASKFHK